MEEIHYAYWLSTLDGIGTYTVRNLLEYAGSYSEIWQLNEAELKKACPKLQSEPAQLIISSRNEIQIMASYEEMLSRGIRFLHPMHPDYPPGLKYINNPPTGIYVMGDLPDPEVLSIAIIGARACSEYGRYVTRKLSGALSRAGVQIISGMALGVDGIAQKAALDAGGYTCGVLGCGVDICYPEDNRYIYNGLISSGGLISEYHPGTGPISGQFPLRNRIISALSDIVVVIEARDRSGSLITADLALEQGKDVYALPGRVTDSLSHGCNRLIRQGAGIILSPEEFIKDIAADYIHGSRKVTPPGSALTGTDKNNAGAVQMTLTGAYGLSDDENSIMKIMDYSPKTVKTLQEESGIEPGRLYSCLMTLTMKGLIVQKGSRYARCSD